MVYKKNVVVTGASGFVGSAICTLLLEHGFTVYGTYHRGKDRLRSLAKNKKFHAARLNLSDMRATHNLIKKVKPDVVFHTAALLPGTSLQNPQAFFDANVIGTLNLLEACRSIGVKKFIHSSSMSVYGTDITRLPVGEHHSLHPYDVYSLTKKLSEDLCIFYAKTYGLHTIILRYSGVFGPGKMSGAVYNFIQSARQAKPLSIHTNISWDLVDVRDVANANLQAYRRIAKIKHAILNIGSGRPTNILDLAKKIVSLTRSKSSITIHSSFKKSPYRFYFDISRAKKLLGFKPRPLDESLQHYINSLL